MDDPLLRNSPDPLTPCEAALASLAEDPVQPEATIRYTSQGRLLVLGEQETIDSIVERLPSNLDVAVALAETCQPLLLHKLASRGIRVLDGLSAIDVGGWLGSFQLTATKADDEQPIPESHFDLILDLLDPPIAQRTNPPIGYFAVASRPEKLEEALAELPQVVGSFDKPNYLRLDPAICDYQQAGVETCGRCFDVCGTWAIGKDDTRILFNPFLCQGCGDCATACPTGSITFNFPSPQRTLSRIQRMLDIYVDKGGKVPVLLLHDSNEGRHWIDDHRARLPINVLPYEIEGLGAVGPEIWLMALAFGAAEVLLLDIGTLSDKTRRLLDQELEWVRCLLTAVGFGPEALRRVSPEELRKTIIRVRPHQPIEPLTDWNEDAGKRAWIRSAVNHLRPATSSAPFVLLPAGAPFGAVQVDPRACTLCMKCVPVCPETVLTGNSDRGELALIEESCIQCGGCVRTCPERAMTLLPRYTFSERARQEVQLLLSRDRECGA